MEKIINTIKYSEAIKIILIITVLTLSLPMIASAQEYTIDESSFGGDSAATIYNDNGANDFSQYQDSSNYSVLKTEGGGELGWEVYNFGPDDPTSLYSSADNPSSQIQTPNYNNSNETITYGSYPIKNNNNSYNISSVNYIPSSYSSYGGYYGGIGFGYGIGSSWTYSGGYMGGRSTYVNPPSYSVGGLNPVVSGGYTGGTSTYVEPSNYNYSNSYSVTSGSYGGGNNYVLPSTYNYQPSTTLTPTDSIGLTSQVVPNQVLAYTDTNPNVSSVYLSDVPNTGIVDYSKTIIFVSLLIVWSGLLAYIMIGKKKENELVLENVSIEKNEQELHPSTSTILNKIGIDQSDIKKIEEYARFKKVLLSAEASNKIVKLARLGKINASQYITNLSIGDWVAVGEDRIN